MNSADALNLAFKADPNAIHSLMCNRVPCNRFLADDQFVQVDGSPVLPDGNFQVGALGLVNAVLAANGLPLVATNFSHEKDIEGRSKLLGFCEYETPTEGHEEMSEELIPATEARRRVDELVGSQGRKLQEAARAEIERAVEAGRSYVSLDIPYQYHEPLKQWLENLKYKVESGDSQREGPWFRVSW